ncbi:hypothetical protein Ddye_012361 [Dipteronia dyeriana]|uniref:Uncharacterized protein n=1 Tax=Dipteronia dyeriana TaxID=168575 RepID=A0AAD9X4C4_9ROSI|nr:hypothetical protein Ddye_012361 [Dipteronia dyeriana]
MQAMMKRKEGLDRGQLGHEELLVSVHLIFGLACVPDELCGLGSSSFLQSGVSEVIYFVEKRLKDPDIAYIALHKLLSMAGVKEEFSINVEEDSAQSILTVQDAADFIEKLKDDA